MQVAEFQTVKSRGPGLVDIVASHWKGELGFVGALIRAPLLAIFLPLCLLAMIPDGHPNSPTFGHLKLPHLN